jgi:UDP-glucose 4-epimerase
MCYEKNRIMDTSVLRTLVFGGGGFIGSHLVRALHEDGLRRVTVVGRRTHPANRLPDGVRYVQVDVGNTDLVTTLLQDTDEVVDLAYSTVPKTSFDDPMQDLLANLPTTVGVMRQAASLPLRCYLLVSSGGTVYGNVGSSPITEAHPTNPISPYGITKLAAEKYAMMFHQLFGMNAVIVRPGNPYGPNQFGLAPQGFIGAALHAAVRGEKVTVFGERGTIRDYIYISDLVTGLIAALNNGKAGETYNIGTGVGCDNYTVLDRINNVVEADGCRVVYDVAPSRPFDVRSNVLDYSRLKMTTGWAPEINLSTGLSYTWAWVRSQLSLK